MAFLVPEISEQLDERSTATSTVTSASEIIAIFQPLAFLKEELHGVSVLQAFEAHPVVLLFVQPRPIIVRELPYMPGPFNPLSAYFSTLAEFQV